MICGKCSTPMYVGYVSGRDILEYACPKCGVPPLHKVSPHHTPSVAENAPQPVPSRKPRPKGSGGLEEDVQAAILKELSARGYRVMQTTVRYKRQNCYSCGAAVVSFKGGYGATPGIPDLLVTRDDWRPGVFIGIEVKSASGRPTDAQKELLGHGRIFVVRNVAEALAAVEGTE